MLVLLLLLLAAAECLEISAATLNDITSDTGARKLQLSIEEHFASSAKR